MVGVLHEREVTMNLVELILEFILELELFAGDVRVIYRVFEGSVYIKDLKISIVIDNYLD